MKRIISVFAVCATALIATSAVSSPATADDRDDRRRHAGQSERQMSWNATDRGGHRRAFRLDRERRHHKFRRNNRRHRHAYGHRQGHGHGYGYGPPRRWHGTRPGAAYALQFDGARFIFRFD